MWLESLEEKKVKNRFELDISDQFSDQFNDVSSVYISQLTRLEFCLCPLLKHIFVLNKLLIIEISLQTLGSICSLTPKNLEF